MKLRQDCPLDLFVHANDLLIEATAEPKGPVHANASHSASWWLAPIRCARRSAARQRLRPDGEIDGGRVDEEVAHPHPSQSRTCRFPASGSSWESLARSGVTMDNSRCWERTAL